MRNKAKGFLKAKKGAELVEIILGVIISIALFAIAVTFITKTIKDNSNGNDVVSGDSVMNTSLVTEGNVVDGSSGYVIVSET